MGSVFTYFMWHSYERAMETRKWTEKTAVVIASQVLTIQTSPHSPLGYRANIRYRFQHDGQSYESKRVKRDDGTSNKKDVIEKVVERYPVGSTVTCYLNPADPKLSVLEHTSKAGLYTIWFPFLFVALGLGICFSAFRMKA